ncbi:hypothetical protein [Neptunicella marina]|uniref:Uncharacterized protein n=1 Tax=Neptunicella marina TaxID=2125989 RepID=A0A8J6IS15_9ALTE|nr:hypothetical protein [Neptunicella marina]MBC3764792.1 hypothetical protein [Neptunicella marina]
MDIAGLVVSGLSALGSLIQAFYTARAEHKNVSKSTLRKAKKRAEQPLKIGTKQVESVIDDVLLQTLLAQIEQHNQQLIAVLQNKTLDDVQQGIQVEKARAQVCKVLKQIKQFNNNQLPTKRLQALWQSHRCE